jgi:ornithine cyclodeaminase/alanine dehydrogenase-like protein (mu-crystallin family)
MRFLRRSDVQRAIAMNETIEVVMQAYIELSTGRAIVPLRAAVAQEEEDGVTLFMPGYLKDSNALAVKVVSVHNRNPQLGLPLINALVLLIDTATGLPLAVMEGGYLTALRTGAASGLATDLLARKDAESAAIIGAGAQARTQILAVAAVRPIKRCCVYAGDRAKVLLLIAEMRHQLDPRIEWVACESPAQAVRDADVICAATNSERPVFNGTDLQNGAHINAIGSYKPEMQEVDTTTIRRASKIVVDSREGVLAEAGDLLVAIKHGVIQESDIYAEIGEIAAGLKAGRENDEEITYFKSVGNAVQDAAVAQLIYRNAIKNNLGVEIDLSE